MKNSRRLPNSAPPGNPEKIHKWRSMCKDIEQSVFESVLHGILPQLRVLHISHHAEENDMPRQE